MSKNHCLVPGKNGLACLVTWPTCQIHAMWMVTDAPTFRSSPPLEVRMVKGLVARFTGWVTADACVTHDFKTPETQNCSNLPVSACPYVGTYVFLFWMWYPNVIGTSLPCHVIAIIPLSLPCHCHVIAAAVIYLYIHVVLCWRLLAADNAIHCHVVASSLPDHGCQGVNVHKLGVSRRAFDT